MKRTLLSIAFSFAVLAAAAGCNGDVNTRNRSSAAQPSRMYTPDEIEAYKKTPEFKASVQAQLQEIRVLFADAINKHIKEGHSTEAFVHFKDHHKGEAIAIVVGEVTAKGWTVRQSFTPSMMIVSAGK